MPTTQISLIREHTEKMKPPRALWVPFELGRPLGVPGDAVWQRRVLHAVLKLFDALSGPVLADFPEDTPTASSEPVTPVCPVHLSNSVTALNDPEQLGEVFLQEIRELRPWYDLAVAKRGRTTVGVSRLEPEMVGRFISAFLNGNVPASAREDVPVFALLKLALEDMKAYYFEAVAAQPGQARVASKALAQWFWRETAAAKVLFTLQELWKESSDGRLRDFSRLLMIPRSHQADSPFRQVQS